MKTVLQVNKQLIIDNSEDGLIILDEHNEITHVINVTGSFIINNCENKTIKEIIELIMNSFEIDEKNNDEIYMDCENYIEHLCKLDIIKKVEVYD